MARPPTSFNLSEEELRKLPAEEKARVIKEWTSRIEKAKTPSGTAYDLMTDDGFGYGTAYTKPNPHATYEASYGSHLGGSPRRLFADPHTPELANASNPYSNKSRGRYHPYPAPQRFRNRTATFAQIEPSVKTHVSKRIEAPCRAFTSTGICRRTGCRKVHDQDKVAICKRFLFKDNCSDGDACPLSHTASPHNTIACNHFRSNACTKDDCRFAHVHVNPSAAVCEAFSRLGYCEKGSTCSDRHAFDECPDFTNKLACQAGDKCPLIHVVHAGRLRTARLSAEAESPSAPSSPESVTLEDKVPSIFPVEKLDTTESLTPDISPGDGFNIPASSVSSMNIPVDSQLDSIHGLSQQADFVPFE